MSKTLPTLYGLTKKNEVKEWKVWTNHNKIIVETGLQNGKKQQFTIEAHGKNIGKANETTSAEQAIAEALSKWKKKVQEGYSEGEPSRPLYPMLAKDYKKFKHKMKFPAYVQPKLNGVRSLVIYKDKEIKFISRNGKEYQTLSHLEVEIKEGFPSGSIIDGEIFHPELNFQEIIRRVKRVKTSRDDLNTNLQYWIFDCINDDIFEERWNYINDVFLEGDYLKLTPTFICEDTSKLKEFHSKFTQDGFEGTIIRAAAGKYLIKHRSDGLLKYKDFIDEEFEIVGAKEGQGKDTATIIFEVQNNVDDATFMVRPRGTHEQRSRWWQERDKLMNKMLTVRFQERSEDNIPIFPVGLSIRDYE